MARSEPEISIFEQECEPLTTDGAAVYVASIIQRLPHVRYARGFDLDPVACARLVSAVNLIEGDLAGIGCEKSAERELHFER